MAGAPASVMKEFQKIAKRVVRCHPGQGRTYLMFPPFTHAPTRERFGPHSELFATAS
jgi:putative component of membrane protein insertase Oxa1/YidC/SpoIIIJ protein YidD